MGLFCAVDSQMSFLGIDISESTKPDFAGGSVAPSQ